MALLNPTRLTSLRWSQPLPSLWKTKKSSSITVLCVPPQKQGSHSQEQEDAGNMCEPCNGKGWLLCDFCQGQKTNVKAENNRIYRRCPSCKAIGYVLCSKCRVFKCVTFPDYSDGELVK